MFRRTRMKLFLSAAVLPFVWSFSPHSRTTQVGQNRSVFLLRREQSSFSSITNRPDRGASNLQGPMEQRKDENQLHPSPKNHGRHHTAFASQLKKALPITLAFGLIFSNLFSAVLPDGGIAMAFDKSLYRYPIEHPYVTASALMLLALVYPVARFILDWRTETKRRLEDLRARTAGLAKGALPLTRMIRVKEDATTTTTSSTAADGDIEDGEEKNLWKMRESSSSVHRAAASLELRKGFQNRTGGGGVGPPGSPPIGLASLSDYLSTLRPAPGLARSIRNSLTRSNDGDADSAAERVRQEVDAILADALIRVLGARLGPAFLPVLGKVPAISKGLASAALKGDRLKAIAGFGEDEASVSGALLSSIPAAVDVGSGISLLVLGAATDSIATVYKEAKKGKIKAKQKNSDDSVNVRDMEGVAVNGENPIEAHGDDGASLDRIGGADALTAMRQGEIKSLTRSFIFPDSIIPNPFIMEEHWDAAIEYMIEREREEWTKQGRGDEHDPDSYPVNVPKPINEPLLPDLYLGFGGAVGTHTYREIIRSRLAAVLMNRLGANDAEGSDRKFVVSVKVGDEKRDISRPDAFVQTLMDLGHEVEACFRLNVVSFGVGLCVKEEEIEVDTDQNGGKATRTRWTNIPIGVILRSGYEDASGRPAHTVLTHGGLDLEVSGPLLGGRVSTQSYHAIDGFCGWYSNQRTNVPWLTEKVELGQPFVGSEAVRAVRVAGLAAATLNTVSTKFDLAFGGYGMMGVCLDSAAVVEQAMRGYTSVYPLLSIGRFSMHVIREARDVLSRLESDPTVDQEVINDMRAVVDSMLKVPNDIASSPARAADAARRMLCCTPPSMPFQIMVESKDVLENIISEHKNTQIVVNNNEEPERVVSE